MIVYILIGFFVLICILAGFGVMSSSIKQKRNQQTQREYAQRYRANGNTLQTTNSTTSTSLNDHQRSYISSLREKQVQKHQAHQADAHSHAHLGEEEHYDDIVGSLGEVNDEGCADLSGVRFVAHDIAYEFGDGEQRNYNKLAQAIVLGEVLNNPRFKSPYSPKK